MHSQAEKHTTEQEKHDQGSIVADEADERLDGHGTRSVGDHSPKRNVMPPARASTPGDLAGTMWGPARKLFPSDVRRRLTGRCFGDGVVSAQGLGYFPAEHETNPLNARTSIRPLVVALVVGGLVLGAEQTSHAQSIGETVEDHLEENLEGNDGDVKKKNQKSTKKSKDDSDSSDGQGKADEKKSESDEPERSKSKKKAASKKKRPKRKSPEKTSSASEKSNGESKTSSKGERVPRKSGAYINGKKVNFLAPGEEPPRVLGENLTFDPQVGFGLRGWHPEQYPALTIKTQHYPQWYVGFDAVFFKRLRIFKAYYQSVGLKSPRNTGAVIAKAATKAAPGAATKALAVLGFQVKFILVPMFRYEARSYEATASPNQPVRLIPFSASPTDDVTQYELTQEDLYAVSTFETAVFGMHYNDRLKGPDGEILPPEFLPFYFGLGLTQYRKPYQVKVGNAVLDELMFNARFRGMGLALGFDIGGGINKLGINFASQAGLGQTHLMHDYTLNEALPDDWFIGYLQGDLKIDYTVKLLNTRPTLLLSPVAQVGATSFYYLKKTGDSDVGAPSSNWDFLYMGMARLILPL